jgi:hypothetical protein
VHPHDFKSVEIKNKYEVKSFILDVGNLFKPLTYNFSGFRGDFIMYYSNKRSQKNPSDENGYELKAEK